ncbi:MAG TPA: hypothetical protein VMV51_12855 [Gemmatimonadaceae bacterium]|nr:hypothetical protein [Gemmatimonadaceae bacterium]
MNHMNGWMGEWSWGRPSFANGIVVLILVLLVVLIARRVREW